MCCSPPEGACRLEYQRSHESGDSVVLFGSISCKTTITTSTVFDLLFRETATDEGEVLLDPAKQREAVMIV